MPEPVRLAVIGAGDLGRTLLQQLKDLPQFKVVGFYDDTRAGAFVNAVPVLGSIDELQQGMHRDRYDMLLMAIGYRHLSVRAILYDRLVKYGFRFATIIHPSACIASDSIIGEGTIVSAGCILDTGVSVGANCLLNIGCVIAHDSRIGAHTFLGPSVNIAGFVSIGERCFLGIGSTIIDNINVGDGSQTAGGAVVIKDVIPEILVAGVPAVEKKRLSR